MCVKIDRDFESFNNFRKVTKIRYLVVGIIGVSRTKVLRRNSPRTTSNIERNMIGGPKERRDQYGIPIL